MTGKHLPPDTAREISALKRRVSDLERMLDRLRRARAKVATNTFDTPYAQLDGRNEATTAVTEELTILTPNLAAVPDPTGHIFVDFENDTHGWFVFKKPGFYEIGGTIRFYDYEITGPGHRQLLIVPSYGDGGYGSPLPVLVVDRSPTDSTVLSGSRMVYVDQQYHLRWHLAAMHDQGENVDVQCVSFWTRFVTLGDPPPVVGSA